jgi:hypothetical protein
VRRANAAFPLKNADGESELPGCRTGVGKEAERYG